MTRRRTSIAAAAAVVALTLLASACGRSLSSATSSAGNISPTVNLTTTTPAGAKAVPQAVWAVYRDVNSLDPAFAFDYPENTAISLMCESLLLQKADGAIVPGLASLSTPNQKTLVLTINPRASFWDGHPVTPADVVYSLDRQLNPSLGGFYGQVFSRVKTIGQTGQDQVTITLNQPDYWLEGELSSMAGIVIEKAYAQAEGKNYGTPAGGVMCTGPYQLKSWSPSAGVVAVASPRYWRGTTPLVKQITLTGVPDNNDLTAGLETGAIQGTYASGGIPTLDQLRKSSAVKVYQGPGWATDAMIISATTGPLANVKVRQALSLALNRQSIINAVYKGAALMPKWLGNPGVFGYGTAVFDRAYQASPALRQNLAEAKKLIAQAGVAGQTITIGTSSEVSSIAFEAGAYQQAAVAIGLKVTLKSVSAQDFINFFTDPSYRKGVDMFPTVNYGDYADPAALLDTVAMPGADQNYDKYSDPQMTALLNQARGTANPDQRAALVAKAEQRAAQTLPWIPTVDPTNVLVMSSKLTGATGSFAYMFAPWATTLGGVG
jgi:peptide/nickel transport system substrate-binding protein